MKKSGELKILAVVGAMLITGVIFAGLMAIWMQKAALSSITEFSLQKTADLIFQSIETTMLEGKADIARKILQDISKIKRIDGISVLGSVGRKAFEAGSPAHEASSAVIGPLIFGYVSSTFGSQRPAILSVALFFLVGLIIIQSVKAGEPNIKASS